MIERPAKFGGNLEYSQYEKLEDDFKEQKLHPMDLKTALAREIAILTAPIRKVMENNEKIIKEAYP